MWSNGTWVVSVPCGWSSFTRLVHSHMGGPLHWYSRGLYKTRTLLMLNRKGDRQTLRLNLGLYRIYIFPIRPEPDLEWQIRPEPDFQIDCNFINLMCKTLRTYEWFEFLIIFCAAFTVMTLLISWFLTYLGLLYVSMAKKRYQVFVYRLCCNCAERLEGSIFS